MEEAWNFFQKKMKGDEMTRKGQDDLGQDNLLQRRAFLGVRGQSIQEDELQKKCASVPANQGFNMLAALKRADAGSPQAADVVEHVMSEDHSLTQKQAEPQYNHNNNQDLDHESSTSSPRSDIHCHPSQEGLQKLNKDNRFNLATSSNNSHLERTTSSHNVSESSADAEQSAAQREQENSHSSRNGYHSPTNVRSHPSSSLPDQSEGEFKSGLNRSLSSSGVNSSFEISDLQRSQSFSASYHDDSSNSSESSFLVSHPGSAHPSSYTRDPVTGQYSYQPNKEGVYFCHLCSFSGTTRSEFEEHMTCHFEHICPHCNYKSRTEGRLKRHIKDFHTDDPPDGFGSKRNMGRPKVFRCKQCDFVATEKTDFWQHARSHIKEEKLLQCPRCEFVTEYKHHLEYHLRNHFGSKPFKCNKCNYSCVNKSMLNSHMKSHTNVYQYRCADCTYATKYCHSLKLHLRKYNHKPATVLNTDGSLPQGIDAESSGLSLLQKRGPPRGPRGPRKDKYDPFVGHLLSLPQSIPGMPPGINGSMMSPYWPLLSQMPNGLHGPPPPLVPTSVSSNLPHIPQNNKLSPTSAFNFRAGIGNSNAPFKCSFCSFAADIKHDLFKHVMKVHASENQDLFSIFGISSEALLEEQNHRMSMLGHQRMPLKFAASPDKMNPFNSSIHVKTEHVEKENTKTSPHSWPNDSPPEPKKAKFDRGGSQYSMSELTYSPYLNGGTSPKVADGPDGEDIIKQMMHKFGSGMPVEHSQSRLRAPTERVYRESPLDLTKPRSPSDEYEGHDTGREYIENEGEVSSSGENSVSMDMQVQSPRKRSRKGKAFKLDTLCLKLQEKQADSPFNSEQGDCDSDDYVDDPEGLQIDEVGYKDESAMDTEPGVDQDENLDERDQSNLKEKRHGDPEDESDEGGIEIQKIHSNLQILNDEVKKDGRTSEDAQENGKALNEDKLSTDENGTASYDPSSDLVNPEEFMAEVNKRKNLPQPVRRGTEVAWKILQDSNGSQFNQISQGEHHPSPPVSETPLKYRAPVELMQFATTSTPKDRNGHHGSKFECPYCEIAFRDCVMYTMHMGYHGYKDPFKCNMCGYQSRDKVEFFLHIAREAHN